MRDINLLNQLAPSSPLRGRPALPMTLPAARGARVSVPPVPLRAVSHHYLAPPLGDAAARATLAWRQSQRRLIPEQGGTRAPPRERGEMIDVGGGTAMPKVIEDMTALTRAIEELWRSVKPASRKRLMTAC